MAFKRALWHSGLKYRTECRTCHTKLEYTDYSLDFRPWYPDGFVYCPKCKTPLRHNEGFAVKENGDPVYTAPVQDGAGFCSECGKKLSAGDKFCSGCGRKL